ncbi:MAG TPA: hypothetical protein VE989_12250 [Sphingomicrobium sp.]|nr:hypothetical protein [Sphingomicrobium sp.]
MTSPVYRPWIIYVVGVFVLLGEIIFLAYGTGWPATPDTCLTLNGDCYCEWFDPELARTGAKGIRQPVNTWSNLYALFTAAWVACRMMRDRKEATPYNVMRSNSPIADAAVFVVLFLGLGSMWFHASMSSAASWMDGFSMYVFAGYLVFYTIDRLLVMRGVSEPTRNLVFWVGWPLNAIIYTDIAGLQVKSEILIGILVGVYILGELFIGLLGGKKFKDGWIGWKDGRAAIYWWCGLILFGLAILFRWLGGDDGPWCFENGKTWFQPHGLLWHTFSGIMALLLYFYWRRENVPKPQPTQ